jgi:hypothetical protein
MGMIVRGIMRKGIFLIPMTIIPLTTPFSISTQRFRFGCDLPRWDQARRTNRVAGARPPRISCERQMPAFQLERLRGEFETGP